MGRPRQLQQLLALAKAALARRRVRPVLRVLPYLLFGGDQRRARPRLSVREGNHGHLGQLGDSFHGFHVFPLRRGDGLDSTGRLNACLVGNSLSEHHGARGLADRELRGICTHLLQMGAPNSLLLLLEAQNVPRLVRGEDVFKDLFRVGGVLGDARVARPMVFH